MEEPDLLDLKLQNIQDQIKVIASELQIQITQLRKKVESYDRKIGKLRLDTSSV